MLAAERLFESLRYLLHAWKYRVQQHRVVRHRNVVHRNAIHRRVEVPERVLGERRGDLSAKSCREIILMHDHAVSRLYDRRRDAGTIPRSDGP